MLNELFTIGDLSFGPVQCEFGEMIATDFVDDEHIERRCGCAGFLVTADMETIGIGAVMNECVNGAAISVPGEDDVCSVSEYLVELLL